MQSVLRSAVSGQIPDVAGATAAAHGPRPPHGNMLSHNRDDNLHLDYDDDDEEDHISLFVGCIFETCIQPWIPHGNPKSGSASNQ